MAVQVDILYGGCLRCEAVHVPSGHVIATEAPADNGGKGSAFSPTDLVAAAFGTCVLTILGLVARRDGLAIEGTRITVVKEMASQPVRRIAALHAVVTFPPECALTTDDRSKLEQAAAACPVKQSLHPDVEATIEFRYP